MFFWDPTFIIILPAMIFAMWASHRVNSTFKKHSLEYSQKGITGAMAAQIVLKANGIYDVRIERVPGNLTDHFDPRENVIRLSDSVYSNTSTAAIGVACHEAGHAVQHAEDYLPMKIRQAIIPMTNIGSKLGLVLFIIGLIFAAFSYSFVYVAYIGIGLFSLTAIFQLVTLPTEFNASKRAIRSIRESGILNVNEIDSAESVLNAAALTYVAALAVALSQILRLLLILGGTRRR